MNRARTTLIGPMLRLLAALLAVSCLPRISAGRRPHDPGIFQFTALTYNLSIYENVVGKNSYAWSHGEEKIGVYLPKGYQQVRFKVVEGDKQQRFKAAARRVGNFAFLTIQHRHEDILNRELQDSFTLLVKAMAKKKNANTLEATATVHVQILDVNDNSGMFAPPFDHQVEVDDLTPIDSKIMRLEAFDADGGLNGDLYYSLPAPSEYFYIESSSGWVRTFAPLDPGKYTLECQTEDRASRLFYYREDMSTAHGFRNRANVTVTVRRAERRPLRITTERCPLLPYHEAPQKAAVLRVDDVEDGLEVAGLVDSSAGNVWLERTTVEGRNSFFLFVARTSNTSISVKVTARDSSISDRIFTEAIELQLDFSSRKLWFVNEETLTRIAANESVPVGHVLAHFRAETTFSEERSKIRYRLHSSNDKHLPFHIDRSSGLLRLRHPMSYDAERHYEFRVVARLEGLDIKAHLDARVEVTDGNNHCPIFSDVPPNFTIQVAKGAPLGSVVYHAKATDADEGRNAEVVYKLVGVDGSDALFAVDALSGKVTTIAPLDARSQWTVKLIAMDSGWPLAHYSQLTLTFHLPTATPTPLSPSEALWDTCQLPNRHPPIFDSAPTDLEVAEDAPIGRVVGRMVAKDLDVGYNGLVQYTASDSHFGVDLFSGEIFVRQDLSRLVDEGRSETVEHSLEVTATDMGIVERKNASITVTVRVTDVNNYAPVFEKYSYIVNVTENNPPGMEVLRLKADDADPGRNGRVEYRMAVDTDYVYVDPDTGAFRVERTLDRETESRLTFLAMAFDRGNPPKFGFTNVTINLLDANDPPRCLRNVHTARVLEDAPNGQLVTCLAVEDGDVGENARLEFSLAKASKLPFRVDARTGCLFTDLKHPLDFEKRPVYNFSVSVRDHGEPPLSVDCPVQVELVDLNENLAPPQFPDMALEASVEENQPAGTEVIRVEATDPEGTPLTYRLVAGSGLGRFRIDPTTGVIHTLEPLDHEHTDAYWLTVRADDSARPQSLSSHVHVYIRVLDVNDRAPVFSQPIYFATITENSPENKVVIKVEATDPDASQGTSGQSSSIKYAIVKGNPQSNFVIDENTGYLVTGRRKLDRETQADHELRVQACDHGNPKLCATVAVVFTVLDTNDNAPTFKSQAYDVKVPAERAGFLCRIFAYDVDADGPNSEIDYEIVGAGSAADSLSVDSFGRIESSKALKVGSTLKFTLMARDRGTPLLEANTSVTLTATGRKTKLTKSNLTPRLSESELWSLLYVSDRDPVGAVIGVVKAVDDDEDTLWWNIPDDATNPNHTFAFRGDSGELVLARPVNLIDASISEWQLTFAVSDGIDTVTDKITIKITRSTSARPKFNEPISQVELASDPPIGFVLFTAHASVEESSVQVSHPQRILYGIHHVDDVAAADALRIDPITGSLIVEKPPSHRLQDFSVVISAKVGGSENFALVHVQRKPSNDHSPQFVSAHYEFVLPTGASTSSAIGKVAAFDADEGENGALSYSIVSGNELGYFSIDEDGALTIAKPVARTFREAVLTVRASDSATLPRSSTCTVRVQRDGAAASDSIRLKSDPPRLVLSDAASPNTVLSTLDVDATGLTRFSFAEPCEYLHLDFATGVVRLRKVLPLQSDEYTLNCSLTLESATPGVENLTLSIVARVSQESANAIHFTRPLYEGSIREGAAPGGIVSTVGSGLFAELPATSMAVQAKAKHTDGPLKYRVLSPREMFFTVDSVSGIVRNSNPIDFDKHPSWQFYVIAQDSSVPPRVASAPALVRVEVVDTNNRAPVFSTASTKFSLHTPVVQGTIVGRVEASDPDAESSLHFAITEPKMERLFAVHRTTGELTVGTNDSSLFTEIDYKLPFSVSDGIHVTHTTVHVKVVDDSKTANRLDSLRFQRSHFKITVRENITAVGTAGQSLLSLWTVGALAGETFRYRLLSPHDSFELDEVNGLLSVVASVPLDRERTPKLELAIEAVSTKDSERRARCIVSIEVEDINDNAPVFHQTPYIVSISEDASVSDRLLSVKAKDADLGMNGVIRYALSDDAPAYLAINKYDGRLTVAAPPPPLSIGAEFTFHIVATDQGSPPLSARVPVLMRVVSRHEPVFSHGRYAAKVSEAAALGTEVVTVRAHSKTNGMLGYRIVDGDPMRQFAVDFFSGVLTVNKALDREEVAVYNLTVEATDVTRVNASAATYVVVSVEDVNDSPPQFEKPIYYLSVSEDTSLGSRIGEVQAKDSDTVPTPNRVSYSLRGPVEIVASIDRSNGQIVLSKPLDFESATVHEYTLVASDADGLSGEAILVIEVTDVNDEPPAFDPRTPSSLRVVVDGEATEQFVHKFDAVDNDTISSLASGRRFEFSFVESTDSTLFSIDPATGILRTSGAVTPQELATLASGTDIEKTLNVSVTDGLFATYKLIRVVFEASRDLVTPLHFEQTVYVATVSENRAATNKSAIISVSAQGGRAPIDYALAGTGSSWPLAVEASTGRVLLSERLDRESAESFSVPITATDAMGQVAFTRLDVVVLDVNDNEPRWIAATDGYSLCIGAAAPEGETIAKVLALDADAEDKLEYSLVTTGSLNPSRYFDINPQYGVITLTRSLSTLTDISGDEIVFAVRVTDNGNPPHQRQIPMRIRVIQPPANVPHFSRPHYLFAVEEDAKVDALVGQLQGNELTQTLRNVRFSIASERASEPLPFTIDTHTGKISVAQLLDRETRAQYNFVVRITSSGSGGGDALHSFALVTIGVLDVNDNAPKFETVYERITVPEDALAGSIVAVLLATDPDEGRNSRVFYGLEADSSLNNAFTVDREYGWLMVGKGGLDREDRPSYQLKVVASDESGRNSTMTIQVDVADVNDSPPRFNQTRYESTVDASNLQVGQLMVAVNLTDPDSSDRGNLKLFVDSDMFAASGTDGVILKRHPTGSRTRYELTLIGSDGIHSVNATAVITFVNSSRVTQACSSTAQDLKIPGNLAQGHVILRFPIAGDELQVRHLIDANQMPFSIRNNSELTVDENYHAKKEYSLRIRVQRERLSDGHKLPSCVEELRLSVENANLMRPRFHQNFTATVPENSIASEEQRHFVLRASAQDDDLGEFGALRYSLAGDQTAAQLFAVDDVTGAVSLRKPLDHESQKEHRFQVVAKDGGGLSAKAFVIIHVEDINDNAPAFAQPVYRLKVLEDEAVGYELLKLHASDKDANAHITYSFAPGSALAQKYITLRPDGTLVLAHRIDYETVRELSFKMLATDDGEPPLTGSVLIELSVLDVNDAPPKFERRLYEAEVRENAPLGTKTVQVLARDADSEHFGKVSYTLSGDDAPFFTITDDGWLLLAKPVDYEKTKLLEVNIRAVDGGTPPLSDDTLVRVTVIDDNDNPPLFAACNMSALVQEGVLPGQTLLTVSISDDDGAANGPPFRLELAGEGASAFAFDPRHNLVATKQLSYAESKEYFLMVTAHDVHGLSSSCPLHIYVKQQSVHPPEVRPLVVTLNTLHGEYLGGEIGRVEATDKDPSDMLRYAIVDPYMSNSAVTAPFSPSALKFTVEPETGVIRAQPDILPGLHRFNVSVTDGRYIVHAPVTVDISNIDQDALDHSVSIRIRNMPAQSFVRTHLQRFHELLAHAVGVPATNIRILSLQNVEETQNATSATIAQNAIGVVNGGTPNGFVESHNLLRSKRKATSLAGTNGFLPLTAGNAGDLDVLFTVVRGENRGYHRPTYVKNQLERGVADLSAQSGLDVTSLTSEVCRRDVCLKGECRDRLWLDNVKLDSVEDPQSGQSFVSPRHVRTFECICRQGYAGRHCDVPVNKCSKELCSRFEMCIPSDTEPTGFLCTCPPGLKGPRCDEPTCDSRACSESAELSVLGNGYFELQLSNTVESRLELSVQFKTVSRNAVVMHGQGINDFHALQVSDGFVEYRWDCGSGLGTAQIAHVRVDDGNWHTVKIVRRGRHARLTLDDSHHAEATSAHGSDVVNLYRNAIVLTFGAKVTHPSEQQFSSASQWFQSLSHSHRLRHPNHQSREVAAELLPRVEQGMIGCFGRIGIDGFDVSKTEQGLRLYNAKIGCDATAMGPCLSAVPCTNGGQCVPDRSAGGYTCVCPSRYTGTHCEIDLNACASSPCPGGIKCHNLYNDFHCACPQGFTGKKCQMRGEWDPCVMNPCGPYGTCVRSHNSFFCNCTNGFGGVNCAERVPKMVADVQFLFSMEFYLFIAVVFIGITLAALAVYVCRKQNGGNGYSKQQQKPNDGSVEPLVPRETAPPAATGTSDRPPPPLPPRSRNLRLGSCSGSGLPTVEVRPVQSTAHRSHVDSSSPVCYSPSAKPAKSHGSGRRSRGNSSSGASNNNLHNGRHVSDNSVERVSSSDEALRKFGRRVDPPSDIDADDEASARAPPRPKKHQQSPMLNGSAKAFGDSVQCLSMCDEDPSGGGRHQRIGDAITHASNVRHERERFFESSAGGRMVVADLSKTGDNSDYLTMKPIHRAKPFKPSASDESDGVSMALLSNASERPPTPPQHRPKPSTTERSSQDTKLYDNPNEGDTLSNVTSNGLGE